ncbi:MAG: TetR family transcriptional regulator [Chloroflexi bacterium]|nr:TetR family transcriptional regulator [Chloroflexota bacterium]
MDERGLSALSMRRLGAELGVDPMAVYHYFSDKRAIVLALVERLLSDFMTTDASGTWPERVRAWARSYRAIALAHPGLVLAILGDTEAVAIAVRQTAGPLLASLSDAGLGPEGIATGVDVIVDYTHGSLLATTRVPDDWALRTTMPGVDGAWLEAAYERGLEVVIAGLEAYKRS